MKNAWGGLMGRRWCGRWRRHWSGSAWLCSSPLPQPSRPSDKAVAAAGPRAPEAWVSNVARGQGVSIEPLRSIATGARVFRIVGERRDGRALDRLLQGIEHSVLVDYSEEDRILKPAAT